MILNAAGALTVTYTPPRPARHVQVRLSGAGLIPAQAGSGAALADGTPLTPEGELPLGHITPDGEALWLFEGSGFIIEGGQILVDAEPTQDPRVFLVPITRYAPEAAGLQYRFDPALTGPLAVTVTGADLITLTRRSGTYALTVDALHVDGTRSSAEYPFDLDLAAPTGRATYQEAPGYGGFLILSGVDRDVRTATLTWPGGTALTFTAGGGDSILSVVTDLVGAPQTVTLTDAAGNTSDNILVRVEIPTELQSGTVTLSPWPLPPDMDPDAPNLSALLAAFAAGLGLSPEDAAQRGDPSTATGDALDTITVLLHTPRRGGEIDADLLDRLLARLLPDKASRAGLAAVLGRVLRQQTVLVDGSSNYAGARNVDGSWRLDGSVQLGGDLVTVPLGPGRVRVLLTAPPADWAFARTLVRRHVAAGVVATLTLQRQAGGGAVFATLTGQVRLTLQHAPQQVPLAPATQARGAITTRAVQLDGRLTINGAWQLGSDGQSNVIVVL